MRWYIIIGTILMAILLTACSVNANAGNSDAETAIVKKENVSGEFTDLVEIIKKAKGTEINLSETTEIILVDGTTGQRIVIDDKDTVKTLVDEFSNTKFTYINEGEESGGYTYRVVFCNNDKTVFDGSFIGDSRIRISSKEFISSEKALNSFKVIKEMFASSTDRTSETDSDENNTETQNENTVKEGWQKVEVDPSTGSKKYISFMLPEEWTYEIVNSEDYPISDLLISFHPKDKTDGSISVGYMTGFGVCGTGLEQEEIDFNGYGAWKGTYYNNTYWDFINLKDEYRDCVITNNAGDTWYEDFEGVVDEILKTVEFKIPDKLLKDGDITDITVTSLPEGYEYKFSDIAAIQNIREYFETLHLESEFTENPNEYNGMTWVLKFTYSDKTEETIYHFGNMFVRNASGQWFKMKYDEAEKLDGILADIEIFPLTSSDDKVDRFLELVGEVPYTGYDNDRFYNVSPSELSEKYGFNIFKLDQSCSSYLMYEDIIYSLGSSFGGYGTTSFAVADINKDGLKELYFTYSWGSGIHRSQIGYFDPATKDVICFNYSNTNNDMTFYVDAGTLVVCNAEVSADSFVDIDTICLTKVGELRFEEDQINFVTSEQAASQTYEGNGNLTQNNAEPDETAEKKKLAEKIQKQLPEDIWGGYYVEPKSEDIIEETETTGEKRQYRRVWYELYICILKDYEDLPEYDEVTYKIVEYSADELSDFLAILQNNKEAIGFYDATISYPDNKVILKILENSYINENLLYTLVPEKAIKKTIQKYGISSTVFTKIKKEIQNRTENVNVVCEYDATQLKIRFDVDWIESSDGDYYPDATISLKDYNSYIEIIRVVLENLDEIDVNIIIEAGDKADVRSPLRVFVREADSLKRDRLLGLDFGVDGKKLDEDRIKTILEEFSEKIQPDSLKFGIDGYLVNLKLEFNKVPEYSVIEDFYELFGSRLTQAGINAELHISVTDTKGEEIYLIYYPYAYGGYRWAWRKTK